MLVATGVLIALLGIAHSILGEIYIVRPLLRQSDPPILDGSRFLRAVVPFAWHLTTVLMVSIAGVLFGIGVGLSMQALVGWIGATLIASGLLPLIYTRGRHLAWVVLFVAGGGCLLWTAGADW